MKIEIFPSEYDVREVIQYYTMPYDGIKRFFQGLGILFASRGKEQIAGFAQSLILEYQDYREIQALALSGGVGKSISGFTLSTADWLADRPEQLFEDITEERTKQLQPSSDQTSSTHQRFEGLVQTSEGIGGRLEYQRLSPGKVVLLNRSEASVEFQITAVQPRLWRVICFPDSNQDVDTLRRILSRMASSVYKTETPSLEQLDVAKRIQFFDDLLLSDLPEWQFEEVIGITVRQPEGCAQDQIGGEEDIESDEEEETSTAEPTVSDLKGIKQAILEGRGLRTNSFVKNCEGQGFYFSSMTIQYRHKHEPEVMNMTVRFKLKPQMFEIVLGEMYQVRELEHLEPCAFEWKRQQEVLRSFWATCNNILEGLGDKVSEGPRQLFLPNAS